MLLGIGRAGVGANAVYVYPLLTCLNVVCAVLCHVIRWYNNGLQAIAILLMVTQDKTDIQRRETHGQDIS